MRRTTRSLALFAALLLASLTASLPALAQGAGRSVAWQRFDADLAIQSDGSVDVVETQTIRFTGTYRQGYRLVPLDRTTGSSNVSVAELINGQSVPYTLGSGQTNTYSASTTADGLQIDWWFQPTTDASRTFQVRYTVNGAVRIYDAGDQLQWRAIYADRDGAVGASTITVHLPVDGDASTVKSAWYQYSASGSIGALASVGSGTLVDARTVQFTLAQLPVQQGAEVRVQFPHGAIAGGPPPWQAQADRADWIQQSVGPIGDFVALLLTLIILGGGGAWLFFAWYSNGRDPAIGAVPPELDLPPSDLPAPVAGTLVHEGATQREAVATLVDLADRGFLRLVDEQRPQLIGSRADIRLTLEAGLDDQRLRDYERVLLIGLFGSSANAHAEVELSAVKAQFQSSISTIEERLSEAVVQQGFFIRNPRTTRNRWIALGVGMLIAGVALLVGAVAAFSSIMHISWLPGIALGVLGGACSLVGAAMPRRTPVGALEAARWRAFAAHLRRVSRAEKPGSALPPHFLPYAVAFGVDQSFLRHLESVGTEPPAWYGRSGPGGIIVMPGGFYGGPWNGPHQHEGGPGGFSGGVAAPPAPNAQGWSDALAALLNVASEALAHGGGSGGWSGGGFGGGGGGGGGSGGFR